MAALDPVILGLLKIGPMTGYRLKQNIERSVGHFWTVSYGGLYPALARLADKGDIELVAEDHDKTYALTEQGRRSFRAWFVQSSTKPVLKDEFLLKLFFARDEELAGLLAEIDRRLVHVSESLQALADVGTEAASMTRGQAVCLALGRVSLEAEMQQLRQLQAEIVRDQQTAMDKAETSNGKETYDDGVGT